MNPREAGFLLLGSCLGDPARRPLTPPQLQRLAARVRLHPIPGAGEEELTPAHLFKLGCSHSEAEHIVSLLSETDRLSAYLDRAGALGLQCLTRANPRYPRRLMRALGDRAPSVLWFDGNLDLLQRTGLSLVGSRELRPENRTFAQAAGLQMARQGYVLVSGGARGADAAAQASCLTGGGQVIAVLAGPLTGASHRNLLLCCEDSFDLPFSPARALSRNRLIHILGEKTLVAQAAFGSGGTWAGATENLRRGWSPVFCFTDGSPGAKALLERGATGVTISQLTDFSSLQPAQTVFFCPYTACGTGFSQAV